MAKTAKPDPFAPGFRADLNLEKRPALARALGELCAEWAHMELKMFGIFASLTGAPLLMSRTIFYSLHTTRARSDMLMSLARAVLGTVPEGDVDHPLNKLETLLAAINRSAGKRNAYVHDAWVAPITDAEVTAQLRLSGDVSHGELGEKKPGDLSQLAQQARKYADQLAHWIQGIDDKLPALLDIHRKQQSLALALMRTGTPRKRK
jgi:hypothetical protein